MRSSGLLALAASFSAATAVYQGFNYGSTQTDGSIKDQAAFEAEFKAAKELTGTNGAFTSARLYTSIQGGTAADPIAAIPAAIAQDTTLLLGIWASSGSATIDSEITALKAAIDLYGDKFTSLVAGISVGSEDLYRITPTGIAAGSNPGADPATLVSYIKQVRAALQGTGLSSVPIGHVDTWTAWVIGSNADVINNVDWLGVDAYPYFQNTQANGIENGESLFFDAYDATAAVSGGKPVWITETGWPVSGKTEAQAVPSLANAKTYWDEVGCAKSFGKINTFWFTLQDAFPTTPNPSFGIVGTTLSSTPLYDLSCSGVSSSSSSSSSSDTIAATGDSSSSASDSSSISASTSTSAAAAAASATGGSGLSPSQGGNGGAGAGGNTSVTGSGSATQTASATASGTGATGTGSAVGTGSLGTTSGIVTSTATSNTSAPTAGSPSSTSSTAASASGNSAASFHSGQFVGGALGAVFAVAALL